MPIQGFKQCVRSNSHLMIGLVGPSRSGKTYSAMLIASGLCQGEPFIVIDSEAGRADHYSDSFAFEQEVIGPPFHPDKFTKAVTKAESRGFQTVIVDTITHEWSGTGGVLWIKDNCGKAAPMDWNIAKKPHKEMIDAFLQCRVNLIFCIRDRKKIEWTKNAKGKTAAKDLGRFPVCDPDFLYEMTVFLTLRNQAPGIVDLSMPNGIMDQHLLAFEPDKHIDSNAGAILGAWARGEEITKPDLALWTEYRNASHEGTAAVRALAENATAEQVKALKPISREVWRNAKIADERRDNEPF